MRDITEIIVHCSATRPDWMAKQQTSEKVAEIRRWHKDRGWRDIGYHFLIDRNGVVAKGRPVMERGAHVKGHNVGTIGICLIGGHSSSETDDFREHFTEKQNKALRKKLGDLLRIYGDIPITGHNQYAAKACPGFNVDKWLNQKTPIQQPKKSGIRAAIIAFLKSLFGVK